ncbi:hypothetical protein P8452_55845 [Trifolium repens]|nr:hypothetical protein P8452_55820 [Trifolium repens]WJX71905.1 hypothetical protein P8452_55845 [Trifolium repens]
MCAIILQKHLQLKGSHLGATVVLKYCIFVTKSCLVLPIFYEMEPTHVRHQTGSYGEAIAKHEKVFQSNKEKYGDNMERLHKWKIALNQAANLSGHHFNPRNGYEYQFTQEIVKYKKIQEQAKLKLYI